MINEAFEHRDQKSIVDNLSSDNRKKDSPRTSNSLGLCLRQVPSWWPNGSRMHKGPHEPIAAVLEALLADVSPITTGHWQLIRCGIPNSRLSIALYSLGDESR